MIPDSVLKQATRFHGHLGPWLVLGLEAGSYARKKLAASPFDLSAKVFCPAGTPYTCFVDGVQFSAGCTMGKGNISHRRAKGCRVEFTREQGIRPRSDASRKCPPLPGTETQRGPGSKLRLDLRPEVWDELHRRSGGGMAEAARLGREFARRRRAELFTWR